MFFDRFCIFATSLCILPACAGINLGGSYRGCLRNHSPRMRGDQPNQLSVLLACWLFSPHARGSTSFDARGKHTFDILPACAGSTLRGACAPRGAMAFTPHARGSTPHPQSFRRGYRILPACAGVTLISVVGKAKILNSPRMRGGQPNKDSFPYSLATAFTPHARGSTHETDTVNSDVMIHPACAGVNLLASIYRNFDFYFPCMRGGQPLGSSEPLNDAEFSPACAGINLVLVDFDDLDIYLPRMRGGQPDFVVDAYTTLFFPLHMQGCSFFTTQNCLEEIT